MGAADRNLAARLSRKSSLCLALSSSFHELIRFRGIVLACLLGIPCLICCCIAICRASKRKNKSSYEDIHGHHAEEAKPPEPYYGVVGGPQQPAPYYSSSGYPTSGAGGYPAGGPAGYAPPDYSKPTQPYPAYPYQG